jgi:lysophospholipase L1-like esterase
MNSLRLLSMALLASACFAAMTAAAEPLAQDWDYAAAMKRVAAQFKGKEGVVLHIGDSITHANPYGQWARSGEGQSDDDKAALAWMHLGADDETDGWYLARFDHPSGGRSHTAAGGIRWNELLSGGKAGLPSLAEMLKTYQPQMVVLMLGTNDASINRKVSDVSRDAQTAIKMILANGTICILSTIPPYVGDPERSKSYNAALREVAKKYELPLIDYEREILKRRPDDWNGTLLNANDVHPTVGMGEVKASSAPTEENLAKSGYLLRGWLSVKKIGEVKRKVIDP